jgi:hypothetical protein
MEAAVGDDTTGGDDDRAAEPETGEQPARSKEDVVRALDELTRDLPTVTDQRSAPASAEGFDSLREEMDRVEREVHHLEAESEKPAASAKEAVLRKLDLMAARLAYWEAEPRRELLGRLEFEDWDGDLRARLDEWRYSH